MAQLAPGTFVVAIFAQTSISGVRVTKSMQFLCHAIHDYNLRFSPQRNQALFLGCVTTRVTRDARGIGMTLTSPQVLIRRG
jgi:hypothetical protein